MLSSGHRQQAADRPDDAVLQLMCRALSNPHSRDEFGPGVPMESASRLLCPHLSTQPCVPTAGEANALARDTAGRRRRRAAAAGVAAAGGQMAAAAQSQHGVLMTATRSGDITRTWVDTSVRRRSHPTTISAHRSQSALRHQ